RLAATGRGNLAVAHRDRCRKTRVARWAEAACWPAVPRQHPVGADGPDRTPCHRPHRHRRRAEADDNPAEDNSLVEGKPEVADRLEQAGSTAPEPSLPMLRKISVVPRLH